MEVIGPSFDDTLLTNNVFEMQKVGMKVSSQTADISTRKKETIVTGYVVEDN